tara:strand:+ start:336 stop:2222 length:1887 start_codon:yes stop_codon:yes gene_type:complete
MPYSKYILKPGINREGTDYSNEGGWFDANLIRFRKGLPEKIGGWQKITSNYVLGIARALHGWVNLSTTKFLGIGTTWKYYVESGNVFNDITPIRATTSAGDVTFAKVANDDATITVSDTAHGAVQNDFVTFSGAASLGGNIVANVLNQEYQIATIVNDNSYTIEAKDTDGDTVLANSSDSGNGGSSTVGAYQINVGLDDYVPGSGWGASSWGSGGFGSTSALSETNQLRLWSNDNFGEDLIINPRAGGVYYWDQSSGLSTRAVALSSLSGANLPPTKALQILVSDIDRHVICLGADPLNDSGTARTGSIDPMFVCWSDQENATEWEPTLSNTAGSFRLSAGSSIVGGLRARQETLVWTDMSLYSMTFIGSPYTFSTNLVNEGVGLIGPKASINAPNGVFWMDLKGFYFYNGSVAALPSSVHDYVFSDINLVQSYKVFGFLNKSFDEVGWFYCSGSSTEIDRYVLYNYVEQTWSIGKLARHSWLDEGVEDYPRATGTDTYNYLYKHETGNDADGSPMDNVYIESSSLDIQEGDYFTFVNRIIPDIRFTGSNSSAAMNIVLKKRNWPAESLSTASTTSVTSSTTNINTRARARQVVLRFESDDDNSEGLREGLGFRVGATRMEIRPNGKR